MPAPPKTHSKTEVANRTVLVVDDEYMIRDLASAILKRNGFQVIAAENGLEALDMFRRDPQRVSVVLLDLLMPLMAGEETLDRLREVRPDVPVILSSGFDESDAVDRFAGRKVNAFVQKPYDNIRLLAAVDRALAQKLI